MMLSCAPESSFPLLVVIILGGVYVIVQRRSATASQFDKPLQVKEVDLGIDPGSKPPFHNKLVCTYFSDFMVKEVVLDQPGDDQISLLPNSALQSPACQRANLPNEIVLDWWGLLGDAKSSYLFLMAGQPFGLKDGFAVFDARTGNELFHDATMRNKPVASAELRGTTLMMRYKRAVQLECSLVRDPKNDGAACWEKTRRALHLDMPAPDCSAAYPRDAPDSAEVPSQIAYDVRAEWDGQQLHVTPLGGTADCAPTP